MSSAACALLMAALSAASTLESGAGLARLSFASFCRAFVRVCWACCSLSWFCASVALWSDCAPEIDRLSVSSAAWAWSMASWSALRVLSSGVGVWSSISCCWALASATFACASESEFGIGGLRVTLLGDLELLER